MGLADGEAWEKDLSYQTPTKDRIVYCDRDPREVGCQYWVRHGAFITSQQASQLVLCGGWGLEVQSGKQT